MTAGGEKILAIARADLERELWLDDALARVWETYFAAEADAAAERVKVMMSVPAASLTREEQEEVLRLAEAIRVTALRRVEDA